MAAAMAMYARIYDSSMRISMGHVCAYLWQQQWPCIRISMAAAMAMYTRISIAVVMAM